MENLKFAASCLAIGVASLGFLAIVVPDTPQQRPKAVVVAKPKVTQPESYWVAVTTSLDKRKVLDGLHEDLDHCKRHIEKIVSPMSQSSTRCEQRFKQVAVVENRRTYWKVYLIKWEDRRELYERHEDYEACRAHMVKYVLPKIQHDPQTYAKCVEQQ